MTRNCSISYYLLFTKDKGTAIPCNTEECSIGHLWPKGRGILSDVTYGHVSGLCICIVGIRCIRPLLSAPIVVAALEAMCDFLDNIISFQQLHCSVSQSKIIMYSLGKINYT